MDTSEKQLQHQVTWACGNKSFSLGGCGPELKARDMGRMTAWHHVAVDSALPFVFWNEFVIAPRPLLHQILYN